MLVELAEECQRLVHGLWAQIQHTMHESSYPELFNDFLALRTELLDGIDNVLAVINRIRKIYNIFLGIPAEQMNHARVETTVTSHIQEITTCQQTTRRMRRCIENFNLRYLDSEERAKRTLSELLKLVAKCDFLILSSEVDVVGMFLEVAKQFESSPSREKLERLQESFNALLLRINTHSVQTLSNIEKCMKEILDHLSEIVGLMYMDPFPVGEIIPRFELIHTLLKTLLGMD